MNELPKYSAPEKKEPEDPVAKSIAKPTAFAKPGSMSMRFRMLKATRPPGRPRKRKRDKRDVLFY